MTDKPDDLVERLKDGLDGIRLFAQDSIDMDPTPRAVLGNLFGIRDSVDQLLSELRQAAALIQTQGKEIAEAKALADEIEAGWDHSRTEWAALVQQEIDKRQAAERALEEMTTEGDGLRKFVRRHACGCDHPCERANEDRDDSCEARAALEARASDAEPLRAKNVVRIPQFGRIAPDQGLDPDFVDNARPDGGDI